MMDRRRLGNTALCVSEIGLGCQSLGGGLYYRNDREAVATLLQAADAGINFFDTADHYSLGRSEVLLGKAFRNKRHTVVISTKVGTGYSPLARVALRARPLLRPFRRGMRGLKVQLHQLRAAHRRYDFTPAYLEQALAKCLRRLRTDYLDLLMLHKPPAAELERGECVDALREFQAQGKIRYYGISCDGAEQACVALRIPGVAAIQITISLLDQAAIPEILPLAKRQHCGVIARNPRAQGHLTDEFSDIMAETYVKNRAESELRRQAACRFGFLANGTRTLSQAAIQFVRQFDAVSVVVPRAVTRAQLNDILGSLRVPPLSADEMGSIAGVTEAIRPMLKSYSYRD